jgi:hypothetical protein
MVKRIPQGADWTAWRLISKTNLTVTRKETTDPHMKAKVKKKLLKSERSVAIARVCYL